MKLTRTAAIKALASAGITTTVDFWGAITAEPRNGVRLIVSTSGARRCRKLVHHVQVFSTVRTPADIRLTEAFRLAKQVRDALHMPVMWSAAGRMIAKVLAA